MQHPVGKKLEMAKYGEQQARRCEKEVLECLRMATMRVSLLCVTRYSLRIFEAPVASDPILRRSRTRGRFRFEGEGNSFTAQRWPSQNRLRSIYSCAPLPTRNFSQPPRINGPSTLLPPSRISRIQITINPKISSREQLSFPNSTNTR